MPVLQKLVQSNIPKTTFGILLLFGVFIFSVHSALGDERSYSYSSINVQALVQKDSTVKIIEQQTYDFQGEYHLGWRSIPLSKISAITDVRVIDGESGQALQYSSSRLDKTKPENWNKYTYFEDNGAVNIEWYFKSPEEFHTWNIEYTVHGALSFLSDHDEFYWNLFTDYDVPVKTAEAVVVLPEDVTLPTKAMYTEPNLSMVSEQTDARTFHFKTTEVPSQGKVSIAVGWQKGMIPVRAFWKDFVLLYLGYWLALLVGLGFVIAGIVRWFLRERYHKGRGTIIAEYEPPENFPPAIANILITEGIGSKAWPATIVDLAVRGYVKIIEENKPHTVLRFLPDEKGYRIEKVKEYSNDAKLRPYEKEFLDILFSAGREYFSTTELAHASDTEKMAMSKKMQVLEKMLYAEVDTDTNAYIVPPSRRGLYFFALFGSSILFGCAFLFGSALFASPYVREYAVLGAATIASALGFWLTSKWNPRLSDLGFRLRDDFRGFKLYLETAEKYRLQNLTPDLFEKFLPYAMIFGVEKKWAKAFDGMNMRQPEWYGGAGYVPLASGISGGEGGGGFSATAFSASFSSSLSSAFTSSGASGASGGGGGAGGGGGGGGGGAS